MKIRIDVDITPAELRSFMGLPNVEPLQEEMLSQVRKKMLSGVEGFDAANLLKPYLPESMQTLSSMQKTFWQTLMSGGSSTINTEDDDHKKDDGKEKK
ncbi:MAG: hypothetical protein HQM14_11710 [SAR324 cluster bacterium]|nr:hypothetical protein [SAR324 cluster bacterium]